VYLPIAERIFQVFGDADCRTALCVVGNEFIAKGVLGEAENEYLCFADTDAELVTSLGLKHLPAFVHLRQDTSLVAAAEGWDKVVAPELLPVMKPTGNWVAAPMNIHRINWLWGSTKAMKKAGIAELPKTWAEFNADCDKVVAAGGRDAGRRPRVPLKRHARRDNHRNSGQRSHETAMLLPTVDEITWLVHGSSPGRGCRRWLSRSRTSSLHCKRGTCGRRRRSSRITALVRVPRGTACCAARASPTPTPIFWSAVRAAAAFGSTRGSGRVWRRRGS
jgi:hypothetical protein